MTERLSKLIALIFVSAIVGCAGTSEKNVTYFGGKIINPKSNFVVLYDNEVVLDTLYLDNNDSFLGGIEFLDEGLYYFKHGNEHQYIYLEPQDSVLIRLNTWDFDESLVFSGKGAERNNLLIDCFLEAEKDDKLFYTFYDKTPSDFRLKVDSIEKKRLETFEDFDTKHPEESEEYKNILKIALTYPLYAKVESYPIAHTAMAKNHDQVALNRDFYKHRDLVRLENDSIMYFYAYRDFVLSHLYNKVSTAGHSYESDAFTVSLLKTIANELKNEKTRNAILRQTVIGHFYRKSSCNVNHDAFDTFFSLTTNEEDKKQVKMLLSDSKKLHKGKKIHNFHIVDYNRTERSIKSLIKGKNSVVYFWNPNYVSKDFIAARINFLTREYPDINFIGVQIDGNGKDRIKKIDIKSQYYINEKSGSYEFLTSKMPRTLLINKKGIVTNGYASLSSRNIYDQIAQLGEK
jgi:hypothetical protein